MTIFEGLTILSGNEVWLSMKSKTATVLKLSRDANLFKRTIIVGNSTLIKVDPRMLDTIAKLLEGQTEGCVGFVLHRSRQDAVTFTNRLEAGFTSTFDVPIIDNKLVAEAMARLVSVTEIETFTISLENRFPK